MLHYVHSSPIYNSQKLERIQMPFNRGMADTVKDVEKEELSSIAGGIASWYNYSENQFGGSSEN